MALFCAAIRGDLVSLIRFLFLNHIHIIIVVIVIIIISLLVSFSHRRQLVVFHWNLSDYTSPWVHRTLLSIPADFNGAVVCMFSIHPLISNSAGFLSTTLDTVPSAPTIIGLTVTFMLHRFFGYLLRLILSLL